MSDSEKRTSGEVLGKVAVSRRGFVKSLTIGTAFAVPFIASYSMDGLRVNMAAAGSNMTDSNNQTHGGPFWFIRKLIYKFFRFFGGHGGKSGR